MKELSVGSIVESICGKCNDVMGHTIMAIVGNEIVKVECRVCKSQHRYRPPTLVTVSEKSAITMKKGSKSDQASSRKAAVVQATRPVMPKSASRKSSAVAAAIQAAQDSWRAMMLAHDGETPRPYSMVESFAVGDFISHSTFGQGQVTGTTSPDKMDVLFESGSKRLLCNKS